MSRRKWVEALLALTLCIVTVCQPGTALADGFPGDNGNNGPGTPPLKVQGPRITLGDGAFAGTWYAFVDNTAFTITIEQEGRIIKAAHTAIFDYGRRVDSSVGGVSIVGTVEGSIAYVEWKSGLSPETGKATLEYLPGRPVTLHWRIVDLPVKPADQNDGTPVEVSYFLPRTAYLIRK